MRVLCVAALFLVLVSGCKAPKAPSNPDLPPGVALEKRPAGGHWSLKAVEVTCVSAPCPSQVGLLIFIFPAKNDFHEIRRCTAFLVGADRIMSNGHCDYTASAVGYFLTAKNADGGAQMRRVTRVITKWFTPDPTDKQIDSGRPDAAVYELEAPIQNMRPLQLAKITDPVYSRLDGYVVNGVKIDKYEIEKVSCTVRRHQAAFPFMIDENPDVIRAFDCGTRPGNSGAPFFAPGSNSVQAIGQATSDVKKLEEKVRRDLKRELQVFERRSSITATNVRCLYAPAGACVAADESTARTRFTRFQKDTIGKLLSREIENSVAGDLRYKASGFYQLTGSGQNELNFEIVYRPFCRISSEIPQAIRIPSELVRLHFNEWGELSEPDRADIQFSTATLVNSSQDRLRLQPSWFSGFGPLSRAADHPRTAWGPMFSIDLPQCPR